MKKILAILLALTMVVGLGVSALAAATADSGKGGSASITITLPTDNAGTDEEITYEVYKVFDATSDGTSSAIAYTINSTNGELTDAMKAAGFAVDSAGNVTFNGTMLDTGDPTDAAIAAVAAYAQDKIGEFKAKPSDGTLQITGLQYGYYYITTTTGSLVTIDSTNPNAEVKDKNEIPGKPKKEIVEGEDFVGSLDEDGKNALAQVGTKVYFSVEIDVVKGAANYVFHDKMTDGLAYDATSLVVDPAASVANTTTAEGDTLTVTFDNDWLAANAGKKITITYSATVTSAALTTDPAHNTASLDYGDGHTTETDTVNVYNAQISVLKNNGKNTETTEDDEPLAGAGFVLKNASGKYYKLANGAVTWVDTIDEADVHTADTNGNVPAFTGLSSGTYTLEEKIVPAGFNKAADVDVTIAEGDVTAANLRQEKTIVNNQGSVLPSTGGIGTTIFYIVGGLMAVGAGVVLVSKKRMSKEDI